MIFNETMATMSGLRERRRRGASVQVRRAKSKQGEEKWTECECSYHSSRASSKAGLGKGLEEQSVSTHSTGQTKTLSNSHIATQDRLEDKTLGSRFCPFMMSCTTWAPLKLRRHPKQCLCKINLKLFFHKHRGNWQKMHLITVTFKRPWKI